MLPTFLGSKCAAWRGYEGCVVAGLSGGTIHFGKYRRHRTVRLKDRGLRNHAEAITQIKFHPAQPRCMITASEDGLLCVFNTSATSEDDALPTIANAIVRTQVRSLRSRTQLRLVFDCNGDARALENRRRL